MKKRWIVLASLLCLSMLTGMLSLNVYADPPETPVVVFCPHNWGPVEYVWADDLSTCTATRTCALDPAHVQTETVEAISSA